MQHIIDFINESEEWNPSLNSHKQAYNNFVKWYDKTLKHMNAEEIVDLLQSAIKDIENASLDFIK